MRDPDLIARAKWMRQNPTPAEAALWYHLRAKRFAAAKFRHQNVIGRYIADFACRRPMLIVEVDGDTHGYQERYDARRTADLERRGYAVARFTNEDVLTNIDGVLWKIGETLKSFSPSGERPREQGGGAVRDGNQAQTPASPRPSPLKGRGGTTASKSLDLKPLSRSREREGPAAQAVGG